MNGLFFKEMQRLRKEMDNAFKMFLEAPKTFPKLYPGKDVALFYEPMADVVEKANEIVAKAEMPGLNKNDIRLDVKDGMLEIKAERKSDENEEAKGFFRHERSYKGFFRMIPLPTQVKVDNLNAKYDNGILTVSLPKEHPAQKKLGHKLR